MAEKHPIPSETDPMAVARALAAPFDPAEVKFKPQAVKGNRALALAYVDVRAIMDRLDKVVGVENWQDRYQLLPDNSVMCQLRIRIGDRWITKADVGGPSEQPDGGDRLKAAFRRSPPSGCSLGPPTSDLVIHRSPIRIRSRHMTELSGSSWYWSCQFSTPSTLSSRSMMARTST